MAKPFPALTPDHRAFIARQHVFFTASAAATGRINLSPKGMDTLRVLGDNSVAYLDYTGSGNETAALLKVDGRMTIMFCAFEGAPLILKLYGQGRVLHRATPDYDSVLAAHFGGTEPLGTRQIVVLEFDLVITSCGYAVPLMDYRADRPNLTRWCENKGEEGIAQYQRKNNAVSLDGLPTGLFD